MKVRLLSGPQLAAISELPGETADSVRVVDVVFRAGRIYSGFMTLDHTLGRFARLMHINRVEYSYFYSQVPAMFAVQVDAGMFGNLNAIIEMQDYLDWVLVHTLRYLSSRR